MAKQRQSNREVGVQSAGFRLQKLRALNFVFDKINHNNQVSICFAVELLGDVYIAEENEFEHTTLVEEDKNYHYETSFTMNNRNILNTFVIFLEIWHDQQFDDSLYFSFYTTAKIGKENRVGKLEKLEIPEEGFLNLIAQDRICNSIFFQTATELIIEEYYSQHKITDSWVKNLTPEEWEIFFKKIVWYFSSDNIENLNAKIIQQIKNHPDYSEKHIGHEHAILNILTDRIDEHQSAKIPSRKVMTERDVKLVFLELSYSQRILDVDPIAPLFCKIEINDKRNIEEKFKAVCPKFSQSSMIQYQTVAVHGKLTKNKYKGNIKVNGLCYRLYYFSKIALESKLNKDSFTEIELTTLLEEIITEAFTNLNTLDNDFDYVILNNISRKELIFDLFDSCYLNFDELRLE